MGLMFYFSPQYSSSKQTAVQNPSMDTLFTRILSIWRRNHFLNLISLTLMRILFWEQFRALSAFFFFKAHTILPRQVIVNSNNSPNLQADELIGLPSITAHCWESWGWTQMPKLSLIPIVPASYPLSTSSIRGSCGVTFQVTTEGNLSQCLEGGGQGSMWSLCTWADVNARNFVEIPGARMVMANLYLGAHLKLCPQPCRGTTHSPADSPRLPSQKERLL